MFKSPRTGEPRNFYCCEWWCMGLWLSNGSIDCVGSPNVKSPLPAFMASLARPMRVARGGLAKAAWPIASRLAKSMGHVDPGKLPQPPRAQVVDVKADALVVGGGLSGLATAYELSRLGLRVALVEANGWLGGRWVEVGARVNGVDVGQYVKDIEGKLKEHGAELHLGVVFDGFFEDAAIGHSLDYSRLLKFNYRYLILATGSREVPLIFPNNYQVPMYTGLTYVKMLKAGKAPRDALIYGSDEWGLAVADAVKGLGVEPLIIDSSMAPRHNAVIKAKAMFGIYIVDAYREGGRFRLRYVTPQGPKKLTEGELTGEALVTTIRAPSYELAAQLNVEVVYEHSLGGFVPRHSWVGELHGANNVFVVGEASGLIPLGLIPMQARVTALYIGLREGLATSQDFDRAVEEFRRSLYTTNAAVADAFNRLEKGLHEVGYFQEPNVPEVPQWPSDLYAMDKAHRQLVCYCSDVTLGDLLEAYLIFSGLGKIKVRLIHEEAPRYRELRPPSMEYLKRATGIGTGGCQGKLCLTSAALILARVLQRKPREIGLPRQRPPTSPIPIGLLAQGD